MGVETSLFFDLAGSDDFNLSSGWSGLAILHTQSDEIGKAEWFDIPQTTALADPHPLSKTVVAAPTRAAGGAFGSSITRLEVGHVDGAPSRGKDATLPEQKPSHKILAGTLQSVMCYTRVQSGLLRKSLDDWGWATDAPTYRPQQRRGTAPRRRSRRRTPASTMARTT
jgi:hypothetical protein